MTEKEQREEIEKLNKPVLDVPDRVIAPLSDMDDLEKSKKCIQYLVERLDNISTLGDAIKPNTRKGFLQYEKQVDAQVEKMSEKIVTDGHNIFFKLPTNLRLRLMRDDHTFLVIDAHDLFDSAMRVYDEQGCSALLTASWCTGQMSCNTRYHRDPKVRREYWEKDVRSFINTLNSTLNFDPNADVEQFAPTEG